MTTSDLQSVRAIEEANDTAPHWREAEYLKLFQREDDASILKRFGTVAGLDGEVVAFGVVSLLTIKGVAEAELESIAVAPAWQRKGIGGVLLLELTREAGKQGARSMSLEVRSSNHAAIELYRRAGFTETGRRHKYYRNSEEDAVLMSVTL